MYANETREGILSFSMSIAECMTVASGGVVGDRVNPFYPDGTVEVRCLDDTNEPLITDQIRSLGGAAIILDNGDLALYVHRHGLRNVWVSGARFDERHIIAYDPEQIEALRGYAPAGIELVYEGSVKVIDPVPALYSDSDVVSPLAS